MAGLGTAAIQPDRAQGEAAQKNFADRQAANDAQHAGYWDQQNRNAAQHSDWNEGQVNNARNAQGFDNYILDQNVVQNNNMYGTGDRRRHAL